MRSFLILFNIAITLLLFDSTTAGTIYPTFIDSKKACTRIGGKWKSSLFENHEMNSCAAPFSEEKCQSIGGVPGGYNNCYLSLSDRGRAIQCKQKGGAYGNFGARHNWCFFEKDRRKCLKEGGKWQPQGMGAQNGCVKFSKDGGKPCTKSSQCEFKKCLYRHSQNQKITPEGNIGECAVSDNPFGCFTYVEDGKIIQGACVD